jgi:hypothetical protein
MELLPIEVGELDDLERAFSIAGSGLVGGVVFTDQTLFLADAAMVAAFTESRRRNFKMVVNLNAAKALAIEISPMLLARSDEVDRMTPWVLGLQLY